MKKGISFRTPTAYFPPAHWIRFAAEADSWTLEAKENYQKGGFRNRCHIIGPNGPQVLSIPLEKGKHQAQPITEVAISYQRDWAREHEQSIRTAYGRAPYFDFYAEELFSILHLRPATLWELNHTLLTKTLQLLQASIEVKPSDDFLLPGSPGAIWPEDIPDSLREYQQVFTDRHGFRPGLSILDALFCLGPETLVR